MKIMVRDLNAIVKILDVLNSTVTVSHQDMVAKTVTELIVTIYQAIQGEKKLLERLKRETQMHSNLR